MEIKARNWRSATNEHAYLLDGDEYILTPGYDFTSTLPAFRVKLHRMCAQKGLKYRTRMDGGQLFLQVYRNTPGDLFTDD